MDLALRKRPPLLSIPGPCPPRWALVLLLYRDTSAGEWFLGPFLIPFQIPEGQSALLCYPAVPPWGSQSLEGHRAPQHPVVAVLLRSHPSLRQLWFGVGAEPHSSVMPRPSPQVSEAAVGALPPLPTTGRGPWGRPPPVPPAAVRAPGPCCPPPPSGIQAGVPRPSLRARRPRPARPPRAQLPAPHGHQAGAPGLLH